jgi:hypothetical protein
LSQLDKEGAGQGGQQACHPSPAQTTQKRKDQNEKVEVKRTKTINSWDSLVVTHPTTNQPAHSLSTTERTGRSVLYVLWSIARGVD